MLALLCPLQHQHLGHKPHPWRTFVAKDGCRHRGKVSASSNTTSKICTVIPAPLGLPSTEWRKGSFFLCLPAPWRPFSQMMCCQIGSYMLAHCSKRHSLSWRQSCMCTLKGQDSLSYHWWMESESTGFSGFDSPKSWASTDLSAQCWCMRMRSGAWSLIHSCQALAVKWGHNLLSAASVVLAMVVPRK